MLLLFDKSEIVHNSTEFASPISIHSNFYLAFSQAIYIDFWTSVNRTSMDCPANTGVYNWDKNEDFERLYSCITNVYNIQLVKNSELNRWENIMISFIDSVLTH